MKKPYSLDYSIERDIDRVVAVRDILDTLEKDPSPTELEQMGSYILYGKDENGLNAVKRGEITDNNKRYSTFKRKEDKNASLDEILENPLADQQALKPANQRSAYTNPKPVIQKPKYDKKTGELIDPGDSDIPGMQDLWDNIAHLERVLAANEGKIAPDEHTPLLQDSYRVYMLKHQLADLRKHQYYLKDAYKPTIHFVAVDHPKTQFIDWTQDCFYWLPLDKWQERVNKALLHTISKNIEDYETRVNEKGETEVKWVVREHTFNWEDPFHVKALINNYDALYDYVHDKLDTYSRMLVFDFERYREMCGFTPIRNFLLQQKIEHVSYPQMLENLQKKFGLTYNENHLSTIFSKELPRAFATTAQKYRLEVETPQDQKKQCFTCKQWFPRTTLFFGINNNRKDHFASNCKECEKKKRIAKGGQGTHDKRSKDTNMH